MVVRWALISLALLANAVCMGFVALLYWARQATFGSGIYGISPSEYFAGHTSIVTRAGAVGFFALVVTSLYWLAAVRMSGPSGMSARAERWMKGSLALIPLWLALIYAGVLLANAGPATLQPGR